MTPDHDDALRARLAATDPMPPSLPVDPPTSPRAQELLERVMLTTEQAPDVPATTRWRKPAALAAAAAAVAAIGLGAVLLDDGGSAPTKAKTTLALKAQGGGPSMGSCIRFSVDVLKDMPVAFGGTVTAVDESSVTLDVDHWYKGGDADVVTISTPSSTTSEGIAEFTKGTRYLVTATEGTVNTCGYTGEATPDLQSSFDEAFAP
ncbi:MAG TPA: hypothetical protein VMZ11_02385 [Mycobacteriales bacterium]|nr:hypothetical protein [Mycobacteriales bacterium]